MAVDVHSLAADLVAEQDALDAVVSVLGDEQWRLPTPSPGWTVADQIGHLTYFDGTATMAIEDPDAFSASRDAARTRLDRGHGGRPHARRLSGHDGADIAGGVAGQPPKAR